jgi:hypothetical protein
MRRSPETLSRPKPIWAEKISGWLWVSYWITPFLAGKKRNFVILIKRFFFRKDRIAIWRNGSRIYILISFGAREGFLGIMPMDGLRRRKGIVRRPFEKPVTGFAG